MSRPFTGSGVPLNFNGTGVVTGRSRARSICYEQLLTYASSSAKCYVERSFSERYFVDQWRALSNPNDWKVTPDTQRLLQQWRHHKFSDVRPFFCQIEAVETVIWLTEVAPQLGKPGKRFLEYLANANNAANPELMRLALKLATGAGKTTVMAMIIAWQTINAVRQPGSSRFTRGLV